MDQKERLEILITKRQLERLKLLKYYSGKSFGEIIRIAIDNMKDKEVRK